MELDVGILEVLVSGGFDDDIFMNTSVVLEIVFEDVWNMIGDSLMVFACVD